MEQYVQTCLTVIDNASPYKFVTGFDSTDIFDFGKSSNPIQNGTICRSHTYKYGPKKLSMGVGTYHYSYVHIIRDGSCEGFYSIHPGWVTTKNTKIYEKNVRADFILQAIPADPGGYFKAVFRLQCHVSAY